VEASGPDLPPGWVVAPDGIPVRPIPLPAGGLIGLAEGRIPPGDYGIHFHYSLEQVTYVLAGRLRVRLGSPQEEVSLGPGEAVFTEPGRSLSFHNDGPQEATVLFICAPPYPSDDADTGHASAHGALPPADLQRAVQRQRHALEAISRLFNARAERLREQGRHFR
jgi:mannose-6-phosphate isomerase-like protein (cupin superfamily)